MTIPNLDELDRVRFDWPEPLVIDLICDQYADLVPIDRRITAAKLHEQVLRAVLGESDADAGKLRGRLVALHDDCGIGRDLMATVDEAVVYELIRLVGVRFRLSPRLREAYGKRLRAAFPKIAVGQPRPPVRPKFAGAPYVSRLRLKARAA